MSVKAPPISHLALRVSGKSIRGNHILQDPVQLNSASRWHHRGRRARRGDLGKETAPQLLTKLRIPLVMGPISSLYREGVCHLLRYGYIRQVVGFRISRDFMLQMSYQKPSLSTVGIGSLLYSSEKIAPRFCVSFRLVG